MFVLLFAAVLDFGRAFYVRTAIENAAREGARYGIIHPDWDLTELQTEADARVKEELSGVAGIDQTKLVTTVARPGATPASVGTDLTVTVTYSGFTLITQVLVPPLPQTISLVSSTTMKVLVGSSN